MLMARRTAGTWTEEDEMAYVAHFFGYSQEEVAKIREKVKADQERKAKEELAAQKAKPLNPMTRLLLILLFKGELDR